jgi:C-terminal processing protease CtpA/Prc
MTRSVAALTVVLATIDRAFSGIALVADGPTYRIFRVIEILEDSPAMEAGLQEGDVITAIDGKTADEVTLAAINEMLEKPVARTLTIRRGDRTITVTLTPRRLV